MKTTIAFSTSILIMALLGVPFAFVDQHLWNWFFVPYFHLVPVSLMVAYGMGLFSLTFFKAIIPIDIDENPKLALISLKNAFSAHTYALITGFVVYSLFCH